tara:strand:- start:1215 stop:2096 length:882 start_codon:yes stop_codon:yes gene_type:complete
LQTRIVLAGADGQLGRSLQAAVPEGVQLVALSRGQLDITDPGAVAACVRQHTPRWVINAAAYTAVDRAEEEVHLAMAVNAEGPGNLAAACAAAGARLIQVSTDFVFDGARSTPYPPGAPTAPLGAYGRSKLVGEQAVQAALPEAVILRTGWVYSRFGGNFVKTMLRLMAERDQLTVVDDQVGTPTWAQGLAQAIWSAIARAVPGGVYHWSDAGVCSWYDFAQAIAEEGHALGLLPRTLALRPIPASDYPTPARRPAFSVLDKRTTWAALELTPLHWREQLRRMLLDYKDNPDG